MVCNTPRNVMVASAMALAVTAGQNTFAGESRSLELPIEGPLTMHETGAGDPIIVSSDERFVLHGRIIDREGGENTIINTFDKAHSHFKGGQSKDKSGSEHFIDDDGSLDVEQLLSFSVGQGDEAVYVWVDPTCPHCHTLLSLQQDEALKREFTFHNLLVPVLGEQASDAVMAASCVDESERAEVVMERKFEDVEARDCDIEGMQNAQRLAHQTRIDAVPVIINAAGAQVRGAPQSRDEFVEFLESGE